VNGSLKECMEAWLRGSLDYIKTVGWVNGRIGNDNMRVCLMKWTVKNVA